jgi:cytochrome c oxidase subunit 4
MAAQNATSEHIMPVKTNLLVFAALIALLIATVVAAQFDLGALNVAIALSIAVAKALLIIRYFMHVRFSSRLAWVFAASGFIWLGILVGLTMSDYISRGWFGLPPGPLGGSPAP